MESERLGASGIIAMHFAVPEGKKWRMVPGEWVHVDGFTHKIKMPGIEFRSGESFGITGYFHIANKMSADASGKLLRGEVSRIRVENGRMVAMDIVASDVELLNPFPSQ